MTSMLGGFKQAAAASFFGTPGWSFVWLIEATTTEGLRMNGEEVRRGLFDLAKDFLQDLNSYFYYILKAFIWPLCMK